MFEQNVPDVWEGYWCLDKSVLIFEEKGNDVWAKVYCMMFGQKGNGVWSEVYWCLGKSGMVHNVTFICEITAFTAMINEDQYFATIGF